MIQKLGISQSQRSRFNPIEKNRESQAGENQFLSHERYTLNGFQRLLIYSFAFFGPLGTLLTPSFMPYAFRFYHFFLLFFPLFFINLKEREWKTILAFVPFLGYCLVSAYFTHNKDFHQDAYPLFRCFLLISQCLFMFGAAFTLRERDERNRLLFLYLAGFFLSLVIGYIFYIGYYLGKISFETIQHYSVEAQIGWGFLRFSPGTYPNEYGNIASFALSLLLIKYSEKKGFWVFIFLGLTFIAFLLTTTRAAYLSFIITMIYLCFTSSNIQKIALKTTFFALSILLILKAYSINFFKIFIAGIQTISFTYGSTGIRFQEWVKGFFDLNDHIILGNGFGSNILAHNVYLELLFELGLAGSLLLVLTLIYYLGENSRRIQKAFTQEKERQVVIVGLIHVLLFATTNHNMHHHLTWFIFLLLNMSVFATQQDDLSPLPNKQQLSLGSAQPPNPALQQ
ncbi:MAG: O-antigen ligase family protein [Chlamydiia bacterium]|nr:O-antigen ligase family protein [Chlamydiia bacterium]